MGKSRDHDHKPPKDKLTPRQESCLRAAKEIAVKFIETGRMSVAAFEENFERIYKTVAKTMAPKD